jgi:hypothetical protein
MPALPLKDLTSIFAKAGQARETRSLEVIESGIAALDQLLPLGGIARGKLTEISGRRSCGKRSLAAAFCARVLQNGRHAAWIDARTSSENQVAGSNRSAGSAFYPLPMLEQGAPLERLLVVRAAGLQPPNKRKPRLYCDAALAAQMTASSTHSSSRNSPSNSLYGALRATDILLQNGGATALTVIDLPAFFDRQLVKRLARLHHGAENSGTALIFISEHTRRYSGSSLGTFISLHLEMQRLSTMRARITITKSKHGNMAHATELTLSTPCAFSE